LGRPLSISTFFISLLVPFICFSHGSPFFILYSLFQRQLWRWWQPEQRVAAERLLLLLLLLLPLLLPLLPLLRLLALLLSIVMKLNFGCLFTSRSIVLLTKNAYALATTAFPL
jgi:hypothetical protein